MRVGDVIEPAALRRNVAYREFFDSIKYEPKVYRSEQYNNCQMNELMFQAGAKGMSERSELIPCNYYTQAYSHNRSRLVGRACDHRLDL